MAHETHSEMHTSKRDNIDQSYWQDVFGSAGEDEEEVEAQVDIEGELVSALEEMKNVRNEFKS